MFVRFRQTTRKLQVSLIETRRVRSYLLTVDLPFANLTEATMEMRRKFTLS
jgi:hypothetical protein